MIKNVYHKQKLFIGTDLLQLKKIPYETITADFGPDVVDPTKPEKPWRVRLKPFESKLIGRKHHWELNTNVYEEKEADEILKKLGYVEKNWEDFTVCKKNDLIYQEDEKDPSKVRSLQITKVWEKGASFDLWDGKNYHTTIEPDYRIRNGFPRPYMVGDPRLAHKRIIA